MHINRNLGLIANYFAEILHKMRRENYNFEIDKKVRLFSIDQEGNERGIAIRDKIAIYRIISGLLKLIFPHKELTDDEWFEITNIAVKLRQNMLDEIKKIEPGIFSRTIGFKIISISSKSEIKGEELESGEELEVSDIRIYLNQDKFLIKTLDYWIFKILVYNQVLKIDKNHCHFNTNNSRDLPICVVEEKLEPLTIDFDQKNEFGKDEVLLPETQKGLEVLDNIFQKFIDEISNIKIIQAKLMKRKEDENLFNEIEKKLEESLQDPELKDLKQKRTFFSNHHRFVMDCQNKYVDLSKFESLPIIKDSLEFVKLVEQKTLVLEDKFQEFKKIFSPYAEKASKILPKEYIREELFNGAQFKLFAFDMNNLITSFKKKTHGARPRGLFKKIKNQILPGSPPYMAFYYASKYFEHYMEQTSDLPNECNHWRIETFRKHDRYADVDQNLTGEICAFIEKYPDKILEFHLGSGDKDLHIVCEYAQKHNIPIFIYVVEENNLSFELEAFTKNIEVLF
ncbi:MAG: BREX system Lon protease-like protein BrxL [Promethearchaeota archaeon]